MEHRKRHRSSDADRGTHKSSHKEVRKEKRHGGRRTSHKGTTRETKREHHKEAHPEPRLRRKSGIPEEPHAKRESRAKQEPRPQQGPHPQQDPLPQGPRTPPEKSFCEVCQIHFTDSSRHYASLQHTIKRNMRHEERKLQKGLAKVSEKRKAYHEAMKNARMVSDLESEDSDSEATLSDDR